MKHFAWDKNPMRRKTMTWEAGFYGESWRNLSAIWWDFGVEVIPWEMDGGLVTYHDDLMGFLLGISMGIPWDFIEL